MYRHQYRKIVEKIRKRHVKQLLQEQVSHYWQHPTETNIPTAYLEGKERSNFLVNLIKQYARPSDSILELGCNVGRNLAALDAEGYHNLYGVEINAEAVKMFHERQPSKLQQNCTIVNDSLEHWLSTSRSFDVVFSMATLEHIHDDSAVEVFANISRITAKCLITVEDEVGISPLHFQRNYKTIFERLGMKQIVNCIPSHVEGLGFDFQARVFRKKK